MRPHFQHIPPSTEYHTQEQWSLAGSGFLPRSLSGSISGLYMAGTSPVSAENSPLGSPVLGKIVVCTMPFQPHDPHYGETSLIVSQSLISLISSCLSMKTMFLLRQTKIIREDSDSEQDKIYQAAVQKLQQGCCCLCNRNQRERAASFPLLSNIITSRFLSWRKERAFKQDRHSVGT